MTDTITLGVQSSGDDDRTTIYVPTEANIPILEANRLRKEKE